MPAEPDTAWTVAQIDKHWPMRLSQAAVDPDTTRVTAETRLDDYPLMAKLSKLGVAAHMGLLFGLVNQILLAALAIGLLCVIVWGYRMWWQRRPSRPTSSRAPAVGSPPSRGAWRGVPGPVLTVGLLLATAVGCALPVLGVTLLAFLTVDLGLAVAHRIRANAPA